jgi:hypothetical protein
MVSTPAITPLDDEPDITQDGSKIVFFGRDGAAYM